MLFGLQVLELYPEGLQVLCGLLDLSLEVFQAGGSVFPGRYVPGQLFSLVQVKLVPRLLDLTFG